MICPTDAAPAELLMLHLPEIRAVSGKPASAAKIVLFPCDQIHGHAAAGIEMGGIVLPVGVDRYKHSLVLALALKNALFVGQHH